MQTRLPYQTLSTVVTAALALTTLGCDRIGVGPCGGGPVDGGFVEVTGLNAITLSTGGLESGYQRLTQYAAIEPSDTITFTVEYTYDYYSLQNELPGLRSRPTSWLFTSAYATVLLPATSNGQAFTDFDVVTLRDLGADYPAGSSIADFVELTVSPIDDAGYEDTPYLEGQITSLPTGIDTLQFTMITTISDRQVFEGETVPLVVQ